MSDTPGKETTLTICSNSPAGQLGLYFTGDDDKREPATAEVVMGPISGESNLCINAQGMKEPLIFPVIQKIDAVLIKSIKNIKQAWGVAINHKDQIVVIAGREGVEEEMARQVSPSREDSYKATCEGGITEKNKEGQFKGGKRTVDVTVERDSALSDHDGDCILIFSLDGKKLSSFGPRGERDGEFNMPRGVAVDEEDNIYVVDKLNSRIQKFSPSGEHLASVGKKGNGELEFDWPKSVSIHPHTKNVYVTEANNHRVQILKPDLTFFHMFGAVDSEGRPRMGKGNGEFNLPLGVAFDKAGRVYVTDGPNDRIQIFTEDGEYIAHFGDKAGDGHLSFPSVVCIDENDILYVTEVDNHRISVFKIMDSTETSLPHSASPPTPSLPMARASTDRYTLPKFLTTFGKKSDHEPFYYGGIAVDKKGVVYVTDSCNDELQIFLI
jgi:DNA-binding beta-propeller fold protein YncE